MVRARWTHKFSMSSRALSDIMAFDFVPCSKTCSQPSTQWDPLKTGIRS